MFFREFKTTTTASRQAVWALWSDVNRWSTWNPGTAHAELKGPFVAGAEFSMTPSGQDPMPFRLTQVQEGVSFTDETSMGDICVTVEHRIVERVGEPLELVYAARVTGPDAAQIGAAITEDFDDVLAALARVAEAEPVAA